MRAPSRRVRYDRRPGKVVIALCATSSWALYKRRRDTLRPG
jgi:hypothetical protein